ncbi:hypothetical protein ABN764_03315 [Paenibacillaceae sp. P-4]|uniref:stalk domain-containing protein n=1 Tax=Paenibacillaceae bacterium P-4 TaxID=3160969 RepID=UPI0032E8217B
MRKAVVASLTCAALLVGLGTGVYAGTNLKKIEAYLDSTAKVKVNGKAVQFNDDKGLALQPIRYNGNVYVPVKGIGSALNVAVAIDSKTNEIIVGEKVIGTPLNAEIFSNSYYSKDPAQTTYSGKNYKEVIYDHSDSSQAPSIIVTPNKKYQKIVIKLAAIDQELTNIEISDLDKNALLKKVDSILPEDGLKEIEANIGGVKNVVISFQVKDGGGYFIPLIDSYYK